MNTWGGEGGRRGCVHVCLVGVVGAAQAAGSKCAAEMVVVCRAGGRRGRVCTYVWEGDKGARGAGREPLPHPPLGHSCHVRAARYTANRLNHQPRCLPTCDGTRLTETTLGPVRVLHCSVDPYLRPARACPPGVPPPRSLPPPSPPHAAPAGKAPTTVHVAFKAANRQVVDDFYAAGLAAGSTDNGKPGLRPNYHPAYYGGFLLDPDGNNIEAVCHCADGGHH